jgi:hypothetical protein
MPMWFDPFREMGPVALLRWQQTWQLLARH